MIDDESDLIFDKTMAGEALVKDIRSEDHVSSITDDKGKHYWDNTIDQSKTYSVKKYEYYRNFQPCSWIIYKIKEISEN